jgi:hypothetical protein
MIIHAYYLLISLFAKQHTVENTKQRHHVYITKKHAIIHVHVFYTYI